MKGGKLLGDNGKKQKLKKIREGLSYFTKEGESVVIIKYIDARDIIVKFYDDFNAEVHTTWHSFQKREIKNPYRRNKFGGYIGEGKYNKKNNLTYYTHWYEMLDRCFGEERKEKQPRYKECFLGDDNWLNFQNFAEWCEGNYYEVPGEVMELDKDILFKGNKVYSPKNCIFVPKRINVLFVKNNINRGKYPIGVSQNGKINIQLRVNCNILTEYKYLGSFPIDRPFQAFTTYKNFKEKYIKQVADEYKGLIPEKLYNAMYNYEVEIND